MKVSVIITTYGSPIGLKKAIESVRGQDYRDFELILVDDNGDNSEYGPEVENIVNNYNEIIYIKHKVNMNGSAARNTGISVAKGEYIALLDDDDWFLPDKLSKQVADLDGIDGEYKICVCWYRMIEPDGRYIEKRYVLGKNPARQILWNQAIFTTSTMMFTKKLWEKLNGFNEIFERRQDIEFLSRAFVIGKSCVVNEVLCERLMLRRNVLKSMNEEIENLNLLRETTREMFEQNGVCDTNRTEDIFNEIIFRMLFKSKKPTNAFKFIFSCGRPFGCIKETLGRTLKNRIDMIFGKKNSIIGKYDIIL